MACLMLFQLMYGVLVGRLVNLGGCFFGAFCLLLMWVSLAIPGGAALWSLAKKGTGLEKRTVLEFKHLELFTIVKYYFTKSKVKEIQSTLTFEVKWSCYFWMSLILNACHNPDKEKEDRKTAVLLSKSRNNSGKPQFYPGNLMVYSGVSLFFLNTRCFGHQPFAPHQRPEAHRGGAAAPPGDAAAQRHLPRPGGQWGRGPLGEVWGWEVLLGVLGLREAGCWGFWG